MIKVQGNVLHPPPSSPGSIVHKVNTLQLHSKRADRKKATAAEKKKKTRKKPEFVKAGRKRRKIFLSLETFSSPLFSLRLITILLNENKVRKIFVAIQVRRFFARNTRKKYM